MDENGENKIVSLNLHSDDDSETNVADRDIAIVDKAIKKKDNNTISIPSNDPSYHFNRKMEINASDVSFGNKIYYQGPVTIKQYTYSNPNLRETSATNKNKQIMPDHECSSAFTGDVDRNIFRIISRKEWCARCAKITTDLELPVNKIIIAHTVTPNGTTMLECSRRVRSIQDYHMDSQLWSDIGYNFLVGGDGNAYEGRGWNKQGAHTKNHNEKSICIAFLGEFCTGKPSEKQLNAARNLIDEGLRLGKIAPDYKLFGHCQLKPTLSPGEDLYQIITEWPNWSAEL